MANTKEKETEANKTADTAENKKRVRSVFGGVLGHLGLRLGETTDDEEYVALLKTKRGKTLVEEVK